MSIPMLDDGAGRVSFRIENLSWLSSAAQRHADQHGEVTLVIAAEDPKRNWPFGSAYYVEESSANDYERNNYAYRYEPSVLAMAPRRD